MLKLKLSVLLLGLTVAVVPAQAASRDAKERAAKRACLNGDPAKGVQILTELYLSSDDPVYLYNQGRCYEQNSRYEEAIGRFREYLRKAKGASSSEKADSESARKHIADCEALLGRKVGPTETVTATTSPTPTPPPPPPPPPPPEPTPQPEQQVVPRVPLQPQPIAAADPSSGSGLRVAGIVTASVGAAGVIAGVLLNLKANSMVSDLQKRYSDGDHSSSEDYKTGSQIAYVAGGVCVGRRNIH